MFISKRGFIVFCLVSAMLAGSLSPVTATISRDGKLRVLVTGANMGGMRYTLSHMAEWVMRSGYIPVRDYEQLRAVRPPHDAVLYLEGLVVYSTARAGGVGVEHYYNEGALDWRNAGRRVKPNIVALGPGNEILATTILEPFARHNYEEHHRGHVRIGRTTIRFGQAASEGDSFADAIDRYFATLPPLQLPQEAFEESVGKAGDDQESGRQQPSISGYDVPIPWRCDMLATGVVQVTGPPEGVVTVIFYHKATGAQLGMAHTATVGMNGLKIQTRSGEPASIRIWIGRSVSGAPKWERQLATRPLE